MNGSPLLTKIWPNKEEWVTPSGGAREEVDRFRRELGTDTLAGGREPAVDQAGALRLIGRAQTRASRTRAR